VPNLVKISQTAIYDLKIFLKSVCRLCLVFTSRWRSRE